MRTVEKTRIKQTLFAGLMLLVLGTSGCTSLTNWLFPEKKPYRVFVYAYSWEASEQNKLNTVEYQGRTIYLSPEPIIHPKMIRGIEAFAVGEGMGLKIHLTGHGAYVWHQTTARYRGKKLVYVLDNEYRGPIEIEQINPDGVITIPGPYRPEEVKKIRERVEANAKS